jgi:hypothetical protein
VQADVNLSSISSLFLFGMFGWGKVLVQLDSELCKGLVITHTFPVVVAVILMACRKNHLRAAPRGVIRDS